jgi:hypothetical protein
MCETRALSLSCRSVRRSLRPSRIRSDWTPPAPFLPWHSSGHNAFHEQRHSKRRGGACVLPVAVASVSRSATPHLPPNGGGAHPFRPHGGLQGPVVAVAFSQGYLVQPLHCRRSRRARFARRADNISLNYKIGFAANHQKMFHLVAADENEAAPRIDAGMIYHAETRLAGTTDL